MEYEIPFFKMLDDCIAPRMQYGNISIQEMREWFLDFDNPENKLPLEFPGIYKNHIITTLFDNYVKIYEEYLYRGLCLYWEILTKKIPLTEKSKTEIFKAVYINQRHLMIYERIARVQFYDAVKTQKGKKEIIAGLKDSIKSCRLNYTHLGAAFSIFNMFIDIDRKELEKIFNKFTPGNSIKKRNNDEYNRRIKIIKFRKTISTYYPDEPALKIAMNMLKMETKKFANWSSKNRKECTSIWNNTTNEEMENLLPDIEKYFRDKYKRKSN